MTDKPVPFFSSFIILMFIGVAIAGFVFCRYVSELLIARTKDRHQERDQSSTSPPPQREFDPYLAFLLIAASWISLSYGVWRFGPYQASIVLTDIVTLLVLGFATAGLVALASFVGGELYEMRNRRKFFLLGARHAFVQVAVSFALIAYGEWEEIIGILVAILLLTETARRYFQVNGKFSLRGPRNPGAAAVDRLAGSGVIAAHRGSGDELGDPAQLVTGWRILEAGAMGALLSSVWFGWYLAAALPFNGHNNEAGGGARTERFRHLVRIKLTRNSLTGYIDEPFKDFSGSPRFRLVDVFMIWCPAERR